jgi:hypothetical protein
MGVHDALLSQRPAPMITVVVLGMAVPPARSDRIS